MFEQGHRYRFTMWRPGKDGGEITESPPYMIISAEPPHVKVRGASSETIINTASLAFVSARED
jgi:hypothetical protein